MSYIAASSGGNDVLLRKQITLRMDTTATPVSTFKILDQLPENELVRVTPTIVAGGSVAASGGPLNLFEFRLYNAFSSNSFYDPTINGSGTYGQFIPLGWAVARLTGGTVNGIAMETIDVGTFDARIIGGGLWTLEVFNLQTGVSSLVANMSAVAITLDIRTGGYLDFEN